MSQRLLQIVVISIVLSLVSCRDTQDLKDTPRGPRRTYEVVMMSGEHVTLQYFDCRVTPIGDFFSVHCFNVTGVYQVDDYSFTCKSIKVVKERGGAMSQRMIAYRARLP